MVFLLWQSTLTDSLHVFILKWSSTSSYIHDTNKLQSYEETEMDKKNHQMFHLQLGNKRDNG